MRTNTALSRRELLELVLAGGLAAGLPSERGATAQPTWRGKAAAPRNVIFMVADGMSLGVLSLAEPFSRVVRGRGTRWYSLLRDQRTVQGCFETWSLDSLVTDSAAASTAWASGVQVCNGALNVLPDGTELVPLLRLWRERGFRVGLVTTTTITHATPAGFAAVQPDRNDELSIAPQYLGRVDVLLGGGRKFFDVGQRPDRRDLLAEFVAGGYSLWERRQQVLSNARAPRVLGLFADGHLPFTIDQRRDGESAENVPTLAEMTAAALELLSQGEPGFFVQVEGGRVDHAAHANDAAALLWDQLAFDDAVEVACAFAERRGDTLVLITSDHGNSNPGLNGVGENYRDSSRCFRSLTRVAASFQSLLPELRAALPKSGREGVVEVLRQNLAFEPSPDEAERLCALVGDSKPDACLCAPNSLLGTLGCIVERHSGVGWTGMEHTADLVWLSAVGPGAERFGGLLRHTEAYERLTELFGIRHVNPRLTPKQAEAYLAQLPARPVTQQPHWA